MFVHLCQEGLTLNDPNNCLQGHSPRQCGSTFGIGIFSVVSMCAKTMQDKLKQLRDSHHDSVICLEIKFKKRVERGLLNAVVSAGD